MSAVPHSTSNIPLEYIYHELKYASDFGLFDELNGNSTSNPFQHDPSYLQSCANQVKSFTLAFQLLRTFSTALEFASIETQVTAPPAGSQQQPTSADIPTNLDIRVGIVIPMGATISAMLAAKKSADDSKAIHDLEMLQKLVGLQLDKYEAELDARFSNPITTAKTEVLGTRILRRTRYTTCDVSSEPAWEVNSAIDRFFAEDSGSDKTKQNLLPGFKSLVNAALNQFLSYTAIGEKSESKYFVFIHHNDVVRIDVKVAFDQSIYYMCLSIVDVAALSTAEFVWLISESTGDDEAAVEKYTKTMEEFYAAARKLKQAQKLPEPKD
ncbi:hypothetical protein MMC27_006696 [Xylographa pallens]|nr:hypothetical protein [Xylographa pallens]